MPEERSTQLDGAAIARSVRELASRARSSLGRPGDEAADRELFEAIGRLERQLEPGTAGDLGRWLSSLRRRVGSRLPLDS